MKKGISPLIAAVLLIVIAVAVSGTMFSWITSFTKSSETKVTNRTEAAMECTGAVVEIKNVFLQNGTNATVRAVVENTGLVDDLVITSAQVFNTTGNNFTSKSVPVTLDRGDIETLLFTEVSSAQCANFSSVRVATPCTNVGDEWRGTPIGC